ncbi:MAG: hypothetical protein ACRD0Y_03900 [Terriglobales bacterium]
MKRSLIALLAAVLALPLLALAQRPLPPQLQKLDVSTGHWVFHGTSHSARTGKTGSWSWDEHCRWSQNREFLECSFSNIWSGKPVRSLVVDTYNPARHSYWHYEIFTSNSAHPFVSQMSIANNVWTESTPKQKIVYVWSPRRVTVKIETSHDGTHWTTVDQGVGIKQP